jgi:hypothetical protein
MASQADVRKIALALPQTIEAADRFAFCVLDKGKPKAFAWAWNERVAPKRPRVARADVIAVRVASLDEKDLLLQSDTVKFFTEPHYDGYPAVLVRLPKVRANELEPLLREAWRCRAPKALTQAPKPTAKKATAKKTATAKKAAQPRRSAPSRAASPARAKRAASAKKARASRRA